MKDSRKITNKMRNDAISDILRAMFLPRYQAFQQSGGELGQEIWEMAIGADAINTLKKLESQTGHSLVTVYGEINCAFFKDDSQPSEMSSRFVLRDKNGSNLGSKYSWVENTDILIDWLPETVSIRRLVLNKQVGMPYGKGFIPSGGLTLAQRSKFQKKLEKRSKEFREFIKELRLTHDHLQQVFCSCKNVGDLKRYMPKAIDYLPVEVRAPQYPVPVLLANQLNDSIP